MNTKIIVIRPTESITRNINLNNIISLNGKWKVGHLNHPVKGFSEHSSSLVPNTLVLSCVELFDGDSFTLNLIKSVIRSETIALPLYNSIVTNGPIFPEALIEEMLLPNLHTIS